MPLLATGSIIGGGLAVMHDSCFAPVAILLLVVGLAAAAVWIRHIRTKCGDGDDCGCPSDPEADMLEPNMFRLGP
jgi:mercuric ion transport protein